jgi:hypothetical protein
MDAALLEKLLTALDDLEVKALGVCFQDIDVGYGMTGAVAVQSLDFDVHSVLLAPPKIGAGFQYRGHPWVTVFDQKFRLAARSQGEGIQVDVRNSVETVTEFLKGSRGGFERVDDRPFEMAPDPRDRLPEIRTDIEDHGTEGITGNLSHVLERVPPQIPLGLRGATDRVPDEIGVAVDLVTEKMEEFLD